MTLFDIASTIRKFGGEVWFVQHGPSGIILRSSLAGRQLRIGVPRPGDTPAPFPEEKNSELLTPKDLSVLTQWLTGFIQSQKKG
ncbi:hypothetical protein EXU85_24315 [Spirosoma sp. KCTC 42546]|uniref:hypothetical protein n=1 Tax=Spirosoma sp. KCTC 42546 TaxID=2520506 RepID=UPI001157DE62|nr:hypothetical protein [Spirosoma sp. KCTC 42546]QDK81563.1 hypothetical protein EXU85_24315 [Spirosoma sp. KCTC 42546]